METNPAFSKYMDHYFDYLGHWDSPSKCGLKLIKRKDGKTLAIATEIYRQNPGTPVTEVVESLAEQVLRTSGEIPSNFIFIEHTPDLGSKLTFYGESFDRVEFDWNDERFSNPVWTRLTKEQVDSMMEE
ncbi:MAG: hypothetical protein NTU51_05040 [Bacteroidetes bacterium]|nr:hypothetical protein [Bacteroidota bacterium]